MANLLSKLTQARRSTERAVICEGVASLPVALLSVAVLSVTACGGGATSTRPDAGDILVQAPATDDTSAGSDVVTDLVAPTMPEVPTPDTSVQEVPELEVPVVPDEVVPDEVEPEVELEVVEPVAEPEYKPNQAVLDGAGDVGCEATAENFRETMLELTNASRIEARMCGAGERDAVSVLSWNDKLTQAARSHAQDMVSNNFFSHDGSDGLSVSHRADAVGYPWRAIGENIAAGQVDMNEAHQGWINSPGHCRNIMNSMYSEIGAACVRDPNSDFGTYWVVVFGDSK